MTTAPYTKTPNAILEAMPEMSEIELKLTAVLVRVTYGFHVKKARLTYDDMVKASKIKSRTSINEAISRVEQRGFFRRGRRSMWFVNSPNSGLNEVDESTEYGLNEMDNSTNSGLDNSTNSGLPSIYKEKEEKENIYIPTDTEPIARMKTAISAISKETMWTKTESLFTEAAYELIGRDAEPEQVATFGTWWKVNGWHNGKPALQNILDHWQDFKDGCNLKKSANGNGHSSRPIPEPEEARTGGLY